MLVLQRREDETIVINEHVRITVLEVRGGHVRIGVEAPKDVLIRRAELPAKQTAAA
jgi:carbon storage regulator